MMLNFPPLPRHRINFFDFLTASQQADAQAWGGNDALDSAIDAMLSQAASAYPKGVLLEVPAGLYISENGGHVLDTPFMLHGHGTPAFDFGNSTPEGGTVFACQHNTNDLFTGSAKSGYFRDMGFLDQAPSRSAGAALHPVGAYVSMRWSYDNIFVRGFWDAIDSQVGDSWYARNPMLVDFKRYGFRVRNTVNADSGDALIFGGRYYAENGTPISAVHQESSGGLQLLSNKVIGNPHDDGGLVGLQHGFSMDVTGAVSGQTWLTDFKCERTVGPPVKITQGWTYMEVRGGFLRTHAPAGDVPAIEANGCAGLLIAGNKTEGSGPAYVLSSCHRVTVQPGEVNHDSVLELNGCTDVRYEGASIAAPLADHPDPAQLVDGSTAFITDAGVVALGDAVPGGGTAAIPAYVKGGQWRALVPVASAYSAEAQQFFDRLATAPDEARATAYADFIDALVAAGLWSKLDVIKLDADFDEATAHTNLKSASYGSSNPDSLPFTQDRGFAASGSDVIVIDYPKNYPVQFTQDDACFFIWVTHNSTNANGAVKQGSVVVTSMYPAYITDSKMYLNINSTVDDPNGVAVTPAAGLYGGVRDGTTINYYQNGVHIGSRTDTPVPVQNAEFYVPVGPYPGFYSAFIAGAKLSHAEASDLNDIVTAYMTAVGNA